MAALAHKIPQTWNHRHVVVRVQNQGGHVQLNASGRLRLTAGYRG